MDSNDGVFDLLARAIFLSVNVDAAVLVDTVCVFVSVSRMCSCSCAACKSTPITASAQTGPKRQTCDGQLISEICVLQGRLVVSLVLLQFHPINVYWPGMAI